MEHAADFPRATTGVMQWRRADGSTGRYEGRLVNLGYGIPRPRRNRFTRALWHLALGYASGFPIWDILTFTAREFPSRPVIRDAIITEE